MKEILSGKDIWERFVGDRKADGYSALSLGKTSLDILRNIVSSERDRRRSGVFPRIDFYMKEIYLNWITGYIATGGQIRFVEKMDTRYIFCRKLEDFRLALAGEIIPPVSNPFMRHYIVMPGDRHRIVILEGRSGNKFYFLDDFSHIGIKAEGLTVELPFSVSINIVCPVEKQGLCESVLSSRNSLNKNPPSKYAEILLKAGADLDELRQCIRTGKGGHLFNAKKPLSVDDPDLSQLRENAKNLVKLIGSPAIEKVFPDGIQPFLPYEVDQDERKAIEVFDLVLAKAEESPGAVAWNLLKDVLDGMGFPPLRTGDFPGRPLDGPGAVKEENKLTPV